MNIVRILALLVITLSPPILLLTYDGDDYFQSADEPEQTRQSSAAELEQNDEDLEQAFAAYAATYKEESAAYEQQIRQQWGEFKDTTPTTWVSYETSDQTRRTVDYDSGTVQVEMIVSTSTSVDQVTGPISRAVDRLLKTTEKDAYATDWVANRVEQRLSQLGFDLETGELSNDRLFSADDLAALEINSTGFVKVTTNAGSTATTDIRDSAKDDHYIIRVSFRIPHTIHARAVKYVSAVTAAAKKERIDDELIYAIIETESSFNPMAKSHIPAYGLMQIVPHTAGKDATKYLFGKARILAPSYLYNPSNNIAIGAAYLHILHYKYMRRVKNEESRIYCSIAAYNTGASNVAKAFINQASFNKAAPEINKLSPQQVYDKLRQFLPQKETRLYIEKVYERMEKYL